MPKPMTNDREKSHSAIVAAKPTNNASASKRSHKLRLILDAHASIAFLAGSVLDLKSSVDTQLAQKGRVGRSIWRADDPLDANAPRFRIEKETVGDGEEIAIAISVARDATPQARTYVAAQLPRVGTLRLAAHPAAGVVGDLERGR